VKTFEDIRMCIKSFEHIRALVDLVKKDVLARDYVNRMRCYLQDVVCDMSSPYFEWTNNIRAAFYGIISSAEMFPGYNLSDRFDREHIQRSIAIVDKMETLGVDCNSFVAYVRQIPDDFTAYRLRNNIAVINEFPSTPHIMAINCMLGGCNHRDHAVSINLMERIYDRHILLRQGSGGQEGAREKPSKD
jgi:hypothetical protein